MAEMAILAVAAITATAAISGGISAKNAADAQAKAQKEQARLAFEENQREAELTAEDVRKLRARQKLQFLASGVSLSGTPMLVLEETKRKGQEEVDAILNRGNALYSLGRQQAAITKSEGRARLIGSIGDAASSLVGGYSQSEQYKILRTKAQ